MLNDYCHILIDKWELLHKYPGGGGERLLVSCVPMREQTKINDEKGYFFRAGQCAALSSFRALGKMLFL